MKRIVVAVVLVVGLGVWSMRAVGEESGKAKAPGTQPAAPTTQAGKIVNKNCPISGEEVDPKGKTVTYKGKTVGFCCDDCIEKFEKDPEKYMKDLK